MEREGETAPEPAPWSGGEIRHSETIELGRLGGDERRRPPLLAALGLAVVVLGLVVGGVVVATRGGATEPVPATEGFMDSLADGDLLGMVASVHPDERDALLDPMADVVDELRRLGVAGDGTDAEDFSAVRLEWDDATMTELARNEQLALVAVEIGELRGTFDPDGLIGSLFDRWIDRSTLEPQSDVATDVRLVLALLPDGDDWKVSLTHSVTVAAMGVDGEVLPPAPTLVPTGAASATEAVRGLVDDLTTGRLTDALTTLDPRELGPLYTWSAEVTDQLADAEQTLGEALSQADIDIDLELSEGTDEHGTFVRLDGLTARIEAFGTSVVVDDQQACTTMAGVEECVDLTADAAASLDPLLEVLPGLEPFLDTEPVDAGVRVVEIDGRWYVSPLGTVLRGAADSLAAIDPAELEALIDDIEELISDPMALFGLAGALGGDLDGLGVPFGLGDATFDDEAFGGDVELAPPPTDGEPLVAPAVVERLQAVLAAPDDASVVPWSTAEAVGFYGDLLATSEGGLEAWWITDAVQLNVAVYDLPGGDPAGLVEALDARHGGEAEGFAFAIGVTDDALVMVWAWSDGGDPTDVAERTLSERLDPTL